MREYSLEQLESMPHVLLELYTNRLNLRQGSSVIMAQALFDYYKTLVDEHVQEDEEEETNGSGSSKVEIDNDNEVDMTVTKITSKPPPKSSGKAKKRKCHRQSRFVGNLRAQVVLVALTCGLLVL